MKRHRVDVGVKKESEKERESERAKKRGGKLSRGPGTTVDQSNVFLAQDYSRKSTGVPR